MEYIENNFIKYDLNTKFVKEKTKRKNKLRKHNIIIFGLVLFLILSIINITMIFCFFEVLQNL